MCKSSMITAFKISNHKAIKLAECPNVPRLMVIYGEPAVGKSTLLHALNQSEICEVATNYDHNSHVVDSTYLSPFLHNDPDRILQRSLHKFEISRRNILAKYYDENNGYIPKGMIPDVYSPLKQLLDFFMPHLRFVGVDIDNNSSDNVKCVFNKTFDHNSVDNDHHYHHNIHNCYHEEIDVTHLTTKEKEILAFFIPLLERQMQKIITNSKFKESNQKNHNPVFLIDDIDFFSPHLQSRILEYSRSLIKQQAEEKEKESDLQFVIVTYSSHLMNSAIKGEELFMLNAQPQLKEDNDEQEYNQLVKMVP
jgi:DNA polymerase III delta prime subunit